MRGDWRRRDCPGEEGRVHGTVRRKEDRTQRAPWREEAEGGTGRGRRRPGGRTGREGQRGGESVRGGGCERGPGSPER